ncbi:MAG: cell wall hydrolase [Sphingomicrobium sp.]
MIFRLQSAALVLAGLTLMSVAPAQAYATPEPLISVASNVLPTRTIVQPIEAIAELPAPAVAADPLAPTLDNDVPADEPIVATPRLTGDLSSKVAAMRSTNPGSRELECLAVGIYYESKSEPLAGQLAVGQVIANRSHSGRFASTYCGVLFQRSQFSFVRGHSYPAPARSSRQWENAVAVAKIVHQKLHVSSVASALFFHAKRVSPKWRLARLGAVGNHFFYR